MFADDRALSPDDDALLARIRSWDRRIVDRGIAWSNINSGSCNADGLARMALLLEAEMALLPGKVERIALAPAEHIDDSGQLVSTTGGHSLLLTVRPDAPMQVALTGHYDTVFPADSAFQTVRHMADGVLNGPGIADMKGGISVMLGALQAFEEHPRSRNVGYQLLLSPDEETGSLGSAPLLANLARRARLGLTYEPALADGTLVSARKGSGNFSILVKGLSAHAGRDFASGRNAVAAAARIAVALDELNGRRDGVTINVARIDGGGGLNVVPDRAILRVNVRVPDGEATDWVQAGIKQALTTGAGDGLEISLHGHMHRPAKPFTDQQQKLFHHVRNVGALIGQKIAWQPSGGVCEGNNLFAYGVPNVDTLGVCGGSIHSAQEFALPDSFVQRACLSALLLARLALT